ncbi:MAG: hypothetical protein AAGF11_42845 [Myxococcota bacterium]
MNSDARKTNSVIPVFTDAICSALPSSRVLALAGLVALHATACTDPGTPADIDVFVTATDGFAEGTGGPDDGLDETGDGGPVPVQEECLFQEQPGYYGYKYHCVGQFTVQILVDDQDPVFLAVDFGQGGSPDSYEEPHVMACCPETSGMPCEDPHIQACVVDMVEQGCKSLVPRLEELADDRPLLKGPILKLAEWIAQASSQAACIQAFLIDTAVTTTEPGCDGDNNDTFDYNDAIEGAVWTFNPDTTNAVDHVEMTILNPEVWDVDAPTDPPEVCLSSGENDHLSFLEIDPMVGDLKVTLSGGSLALQGPLINGELVSGQADFSSTATSCAAPYCSRAAWSLGVLDGQLHAMDFYSREPTEVGTSAESLTVESFQLHLFAPVRGAVSGGVLTIPAGEALFVLSGQVLDEGRWVTARNATPIQIQAAAEDWSIGGFTIDYRDGVGDSWSLALAPSSWQ